MNNKVTVSHFWPRCPVLASTFHRFDRVLAIDILAANERSCIISREVSCVSFDLSFLSDLQCLTSSQHFASVAAC